jgi:hypothetical protein
VLFALVEDGVVTLYDTTVPNLVNLAVQGSAGRVSKNKSKGKSGGGSKAKKAKRA